MAAQGPSANGQTPGTTSLVSAAKAELNGAASALYGALRVERNARLEAAAKKAAAKKAAAKKAAAKKAAAEKKAAARKAKAKKAASVAKSYVGVPYIYGGASPNGFDCSGLTSYAYGKVGVTLTHNAQAQFNECKSVSLDSLRVGDLVFFGSGAYGIRHVGMYVGNGNYVHAPRPGACVRVDALADRTDCVGACRPC